MLLAAPFLTKSVAVAYAHIAYMDDLGEFKTFQLTTIPDVFRRVAELIEDVSGKRLSKEVIANGGNIDIRREKSCKVISTLRAHWSQRTRKSHGVRL